MSLPSLSSLTPEIIWTILGLIFIFAEFFIPGLVIAFFGVGALITALTTWIGITPSISLQILVFTVFSILLLVFLRKFMKSVFMGTSNPDNGKVSFDIQVGEIVPCTEMIIPGEVGGKVKYHGTSWDARSAETIAPGESVKITGRDNITLLVEKIKK